MVALESNKHICKNTDSNNSHLSHLVKDNFTKIVAHIDKKLEQLIDEKLSRYFNKEDKNISHNNQLLKNSEKEFKKLNYEFG